MLQSALLQLTQAGILVEADLDQSTNFVPGTESHSMPVPWVRATMLIRANNAIRGHSGVRLEIVEGIMHLLRNKITPIIPVRGSISASGDLMPLSYIAGVLEGNPDIFVRIQQREQSRIMSAPEALRLCGLQAYVLGPKEGLGLINGTAASAAVACFGLHESTKLISLAQMLVAMSCEALLGNTESYHPFIHAVRPHPGQIECASNILRFLKGSKLAVSLADQDRFKPGLFQDRYALRGTPQWLGPQLEDFDSAVAQLTTELNSTSDNPLIDSQTGGVYSGANFIASSVASGMEKSRLSLQIIGRLLFSLSSELINPALNRGLPPNLAADDPSLSFTMKGIDISMAAYMSELAFLANPVTSHVQSAESHNQQINSLALISARYTVQSADILSQMCAAHLYVACQALDLRVLYVTFLEELRNSIGTVTRVLVPEVHSDVHTELDQTVFQALSSSWNSTTSLDIEDRCKKVAAASLPNAINYLHKHGLVSSTEKLVQFEFQMAELVRSSFVKKRQDFFTEQTTPSYLGCAAKSLYRFVRKELNVPFHKGLVEHPTVRFSSQVNIGVRKTIGSWVSVIHAAIANDRIWTAMAGHLS